MRNLFVMMACLVGMTAYASEGSDTTIVNNAGRVVVVTTDTMQHVKILGKEGDATYVYDKTVKVRKTANKDDEERTHHVDLDLGVGVAIPTNVPEGYSFAPFSSWEWIVGLRYEYTPKNKLQTYSAGLWCNWRSYALSGNRMFAKADQDVIVLDEFAPGASTKTSSLRIFSLSVPFLFTQKFGHNSKWSFTLGPVVNFNLYGRLNNEYTLGDYEFDTNVKNIEYRPVTIDFMCIITYKKTSLYCKYSPMSVLKNDKGPQFHSLTCGFYF